MTISRRDMLLSSALLAGALAKSAKAAPGGTFHSWRKMAKSRSTFLGSFFGWMMKKPSIPIAICTISSECGWYICVPCCFSVNSYW